MPRSVQITTPRPPIDSLVKRLRIPKARQRELLAIMRETDTKTPTATAGGVLIVTGIEGAQSYAAVAGMQLGIDVEVSKDRNAALNTLRDREFSVVVVDETIVECDPVSAEAIWEYTGLAIPMQMNFELSGASRLVREIRSALHRRERETVIAQKAAVAAIETEIKSTVADLTVRLRGSLPIHAPFDKKVPAA